MAEGRQAGSSRRNRLDRNHDTSVANRAVQLCDRCDEMIQTAPIPRESKVARNFHWRELGESGAGAGGDHWRRLRPRFALQLTVSRPVGGILSSSRRSLGGHPSERPTWGTLPFERRASSPFPTLDLAPGGVYLAGGVTPAAGALLPHPFTLTCTGPEARHRRFPFCGTVLRVTPTGR